MKRIAIVLAALSVVLAPGTVLAQSSACQAYNPQLCSEAATSGVASNGTLPFTGLDVGLLAVGGGLLFVGGMLLRARIKRLG